jgi:predicted ferric reductase
MVHNEFPIFFSRFGSYIWPAILLLGLDRILRALRVVVFNFDYITGKRSTELDARVDVLSPDFLRITLHRPNHINWAPGQTAYISIPRITPFQSHPFTISTIDVGGMPLAKYATEGQLPLSYSKLKKLEFLIRVRKGFTARLLHAAQDNQSLKVFFEGPYCSPPLLKGYDTVILIAGTLSSSLLWNNAS